MNSIQTAGLVFMLVGMVASRIINERAYRRLTSEEKLRLMDGFSSTRAYSLIPLFIGLGAYWLLLSQSNIDRASLTIFFVAAFIAYIVLRLFLNYRMLGRLDLPDHYRSSYVLSQGVALAGTAVLTAALIAT